MKNQILFIITFLFFLSPCLPAQTRNLSQVMELKMPKTSADENCGTRGGSVCWNPDTKKYYATFCGNSKYPMAVFTAAGKRVSDDDLTSMEDIRGLWYDPASKKLMANGYDEIGWLKFSINSNDIPVRINYAFTDMNQPNSQVVGSYDTILKKVFFLDKSRVMLYENFADMFARADDSVQIHWGRKKAEGPAGYENQMNTNEDYNYTSVAATNIKDAEFGLLNTLEKQIELYDRKEGYLRLSLKLPSTAPVENAFNFACSNGIYWLFDMENRKWIGYK